MGFLSNMFSGPKAAPAAPTPPPPPPAAIPATFASGTQAGTKAAQQRMAAGAGLGFDNTMFAGGSAPAQTALKTLTGA